MSDNTQVNNGSGDTIRDDRQRQRHPKAQSHGAGQWRRRRGESGSGPATAERGDLSSQVDDAAFTPATSRITGSAPSSTTSLPDPVDEARWRQRSACQPGARL